MSTIIYVLSALKKRLLEKFRLCAKKITFDRKMIIISFVGDIFYVDLPIILSIDNSKNKSSPEDFEFTKLDCIY